jgi:hypothetical protein
MRYLEIAALRVIAGAFGFDWEPRSLGWSTATRWLRRRPG